MTSNLRLASYRLGIVLAVGLILELGVRSGWLDTLFFSSPTQIWEKAVRLLDQGRFFVIVGTTVGEALAGFVLGSIAAIAVGLLLSRARGLANVLEPFIMMLYSTPLLALAPLFVLWFGLGFASKVVMSFLLVFLTTVIPVYHGALYIDREYIDTLRVFRATPGQIFFKVILPGCAPAIYSGLKLGIGVSLIGAVISEFVGAKQGIGQMILLSSSLLDTPGVYLGIVLLMSLAALMNEAVIQLGKRFLVRWKYYDEKRLRYVPAHARSRERPVIPGQR